jgi:flagellar motor switch protein FliM
MPDILSQTEIDELLEVSTPAYPMLNKWLVERLALEEKDLSLLTTQVVGVLHSDMPEADIDDQLVEVLVERARTAKKKFTKKQIDALYPEVVELVAEMRRVREGNQKREDEEKAKKRHQKASGQRIITSYDFKHPARVNKEQLRTLENLHDNFARLLSSTLSGAMRAVVDVDTAFVDQTTYAEFIMSLSNPSCSYQFTLGPTNGQAILDIAMPVVFAQVDRSFGGKGSSQGVDARQLTPIEIGEINTVVKKMIEDLEATWEPILPVNIHDIELETNPEFMQITAASEIVILLAFEVNSTNASGLISLCYPFFTLESILPRLGQQNYVKMRQGNQNTLVRDNRLRLGGMALDVCAELGRSELSLAQARALKVGDVVGLDRKTDEPVPVFVGGDAKFLGWPCASAHGLNAVKVAGALPAEREDGFR